MLKSNVFVKFSDKNTAFWAVSASHWYLLSKAEGERVWQELSVENKNDSFVLACFEIRAAGSTKGRTSKDDNFTEISATLKVKKKCKNAKKTKRGKEKKCTKINWLSFKVHFSFLYNEVTFSLILIIRQVTRSLKSLVNIATRQFLKKLSADKLPIKIVKSGNSLTPVPVVSTCSTAAW